MVKIIRDALTTTDHFLIVHVFNIPNGIDNHKIPGGNLLSSRIQVYIFVWYAND